MPSPRADMRGFGARIGSRYMGQNAELDAGSRAVGGTVSLPLGSFLLRCLLYILEN